MFPVFEPALALFEPVTLGLVVLAAATVAGMFAVVGLVAVASRRPAGPSAPASRIRSDLPEAA
jgi:hypothetical protein